MHQSVSDSYFLQCELLYLLIFPALEIINDRYSLIR